jgi:activator of HSP90 ATPase
MPKKKTAKPVALKTLRQTVTLKASPKQVYDLFMSSKLHTAFTGDEAKISTKVGGKFTVFSGYSEGRHLKLAPGKLIVQTWRASDWPQGHYSEASFSLAAVQGGCKLSFVQTGIPAKQLPHMRKGWKEFYWDKLKAYLKDRP